MAWLRSTTTQLAARPESPADAVGAGLIPTQRRAVEETDLLLPDRAGRGLADLAASAASGGLDTWLVSRVTGGAYTPLAGSSPDPRLAIGASLPWRDTLCRALLHSPAAVMEGDLDALPGGAASDAARALGIHAYVGAPLLAADGTVAGSVCGLSTTGRVDDDELLRVQVGDRAAALSRTLARDLQRVEVARGEDREAALRSTDPLTGLPDRRAWGLLLDREETRAAALAEPSGIVLVDLGVVRSVRAVRRAVAAVREVVGDAGPVARLSARQLGVLAAGVPEAGVAELGSHLRVQVAGTASGAGVGWASRRGPSPLGSAWTLAEHDLLEARRAPAPAGGSA